MKSPRKPKSVRERAMDLLARREHPRKELAQKLLQKSLDPDEIDEALDYLEKKGWLSDLRFAESWIRHRIQGGYGKQRTIAELHQKGVDSDTIDAALCSEQPDWRPAIEKAWFRKYQQVADDWQTRAKQMRYLQARGFGSNEIQQFFQTIQHDLGES